MKAMIFAAGLGTRLKPLTDTMPKALVPVCGKPLLWHVMTKLKASGITDVTVNVHHFADMIVSYLDSVNGLGMDVHISDERDMLLETGGGIRHAERYLCRPAGHVAGAGYDEVGHVGALVVIFERAVYFGVGRAGGGAYSAGDAKTVCRDTQYAP